MGGKLQRQKDLSEARQLRAERERLKRQSALRMLANGLTVEDVMSALHTTRPTVNKWKREMDNG